MDTHRNKDAEALPLVAPSVVLGVLLTLLVYCAFLRFHDLQADSFWIDEAVIVAQANGILSKGYPVYPDGSVSWDNTPYNYLVASLLALNVDPHIAARLWPALFGTTAVALTFFTSLRLTASYSTSLLAAFLFGLSCFSVDWSRQAKIYPMIQCIILGITLLLPTDHPISRWRCFVLLALCAIGITLHRAGYVSLVLIVVHLFAYRNKHLSFSIISLMPVAIPLSVIILIAFYSGSTSSAKALYSSIIHGEHFDYGGMYLRIMYEQHGLGIALAAICLPLAFISKNSRPLAIGCAAYLIIISLKTNLFAFRYLLPIYPALCILLATPLLVVDNVRMRNRHFPTHLRSIFKMLITIFLLSQSNICWIKDSPRIVDPSAPRPAWREIFAMISEREKDFTHEEDNRPTIISAFPLMVDSYCDTNRYLKGYIPITTTGYPGDEQWHPPYTTAQVFKSLAEITNTTGYLVLDDFGIRMMLNKEISDHFTKKPPDVIIDGDFPIYAWILKDG